MIVSKTKGINTQNASLPNCLTTCCCCPCSWDSFQLSLPGLLLNTPSQLCPETGLGSWWEYLLHGNQQMLQIRAFVP